MAYFPIGEESWWERANTRVAGYTRSCAWWIPLAIAICLAIVAMIVGAATMPEIECTLSCCEKMCCFACTRCGVLPDCNGTR